MAKQERQTDSQNSSVLRETIRAELEETSAKFHTLLKSLSATDLQRKSINPAWTIKDLLVHIIYWLARTPGLVQYVRRWSWASHFPVFLFNCLNIWLTRFAARKQTLQSLAEQYDAALAATLHVLDSVREDEWNKGAVLLGNERSTVESLIRSHREHFEEHAEQIRQSLGEVGKQAC